MSAGGHRSQFAVDCSVVQKIRLHAGISRVELSRQLSIAPSTVGISVERLVERGFLRQGHRLESTSGRPPTRIELNPDAGQFIGIDLDSRHIHGVSVDFAQRVLRDRTVPLRANASTEEVLKQIDTVVEDVKDQSRELLGIGVGVPGTVNANQGVAIHYQFIRNWKNIPLASRLNNRFMVPVKLENNIRAMAVAERWFGQGKDVENYFCLGIRSGIGAGLIVDGELYRGPNHFAGEIGSWSCIVPGEKKAMPLEQIASLKSILQTLTGGARAGKSDSLSLFRNRVTTESMYEAAASGDKFTCSVLKEAGELIGQVISQMVLLLDPQKVILAGPLSKTGDAFLSPLTQRLHELLPALHAKVPEVCYSKLGDLVGALGAAALSAHDWQPQVICESKC